MAAMAVRFGFRSAILLVFRRLLLWFLFSGLLLLLAFLLLLFLLLLLVFLVRRLRFRRFLRLWRFGLLLVRRFLLFLVLLLVLWLLWVGRSPRQQHEERGTHDESHSSSLVLMFLAIETSACVLGLEQRGPAARFN